MPGNEAFLSPNTGFSDPPVCPTLEMGSKAITWIHLNLHRFMPSRDDLQPSNKDVQSLGELALFCWLVLERTKRFAEDSRIWSCAFKIKEVYDEPVFFERLYRVPDPLISQALIAVSLYRLGLLSEAGLQPLRTMLNISNALVSERFPHRQLEIKHILDAGGISSHLPSYDALYRSSVAGKMLNPIYATDFDVYSLTHVLFYSFDFAGKGALEPSLPLIAEACESVETLLGVYIRKKNWDLVGELLLCCHCLNRTSSLLYSIGWTELIAAQMQSGAIPGPTYSESKRDECVDAQQEDYVFEHCYHTTLVAALGAALCGAIKT
jgi:hypothetical protein